jgi:hypothetical protein
MPREPGLHRSTMHGMIHSSPVPPSSPSQSDDIAILRAWMDAELSHPAPACQMSPRGAQRCGGCPACATYTKTIVSAVTSAIERCKDRRAGRGTLTSLYDQVPPWMRPYFGLAWGEGLKRLLGRWGKDSEFIPGEAPERWRLTQDEATVYWWELRGLKDWEMQREWTAKGLRMDRAHWVPAERVNDALESARAKMQGMFGLSGA